MGSFFNPLVNVLLNHAKGSSHSARELSATAVAISLRGREMKW